VDLPPGTYEITVSAQAFWENRFFHLSVNGTPLGEPIEVEVDSLHTYMFTLPAEVVGDGKNLTLLLNYDSWVLPADVMESGDVRKLAVAVDWIRFERK
jgi:hypothetical protein